MTTAMFENRVVLQGVSWETYLKLRGEDHHSRMTYSQGVLEVMTLSRRHERVNKILARMIEAWTEENEIEIVGDRSITLKADELKKGLEPDECFYIESADQVMGNEEVDLSFEPPPDLALEVEVSHPLIRRLPIYLALGVPEVWHWKEERIRILILQDEEFREAVDSDALPGFPFDVAAEILSDRFTAGHTALIRRFRKQIRSSL